MWNKVLLTVIFLFNFGFLTVHSSIAHAEWSSVSPDGVTDAFYGVWGSSANDVYVVGTLGKKLHYDGNPEGTWKDQGKDSG